METMGGRELGQHSLPGHRLDLPHQRLISSQYVLDPAQLVPPKIAMRAANAHFAVRTLERRRMPEMALDTRPAEERLAALYNRPRLTVCWVAGDQAKAKVKNVMECNEM